MMLVRVSQVLEGCRSIREVKVLGKWPTWHIFGAFFDPTPAELGHVLFRKLLKLQYDPRGAKFGRNLIRKKCCKNMPEVPFGVYYKVPRVRRASWTLSRLTAPPRETTLRRTLPGIEGRDARLARAP